MWFPSSPGDAEQHGENELPSSLGHCVGCRRACPVACAGRGLGWGLGQQLRQGQAWDEETGWGVGEMAGPERQGPPLNRLWSLLEGSSALGLSFLICKARGLNWVMSEVPPAPVCLSFPRFPLHWQHSGIMRNHVP